MKGNRMDNPDRCSALLRSRGHRLTPQRLVILQVLKDARQHLTPAQVFERALQILPGLTEPTVYRTLAFLAAQGLALASRTGSGQIHYEYATHQHHHLVCRACGHMLEVESTVLNDLYAYFLAKTGYKIDSVHITFTGTCPHCQKG